MPKSEELSTDEWKRAIYDLRQWIGPCRVQFAGGETFVRTDLTDIIRFATNHDVLTGLVSNGTMITRELAREIVDSGLGYIHISVDGISPDIHDSIRGLPGVYQKTMTGIDHLIEASKRSGLSISIATIIMKKNMHELLDLVKWVEARGLDGIIFNPLGPTVDSDPDWYKKTDLWFDELGEINRILDRLIEAKKRGARILNPPQQFEEMKKYFEKPYLPRRDNCWVGITNLGVTCDGYIHTCLKMPPLGNVRDVGVGEVWDSEKAREVRQMIKHCDIHCSPGNFIYRRSLLGEIARFIKFGR
jgi:MoaA/NifB/PqqE/SkfB family radical SAM enzyme